MTVAEYRQNLKENIAALHQRLVNRKYRAQPARRVWIPKSDGSQRPLAILVLEDKLVQRAVAILLEAVYEPHFHAFSHGFRRQHSAHGALSYLRDQCLKRGVNWIIDADIAKFFDTIKPVHLRTILHTWRTALRSARAGPRAGPARTRFGTSATPSSCIWSRIRQGCRRTRSTRCWS